MSAVARVVCCQVEVSATSWSLVQRSPTKCGVSCVIYKPREWGGPGPLGAVEPKKLGWSIPLFFDMALPQWDLNITTESIALIFKGRKIVEDISICRTYCPLKMRTVTFLEIPGSVYTLTQHHIKDEGNTQPHGCQRIKPAQQCWSRVFVLLCCPVSWIPIIKICCCTWSMRG
jgi:hypothetical protein